MSEGMNKAVKMVVFYFFMVLLTLVVATPAWTRSPNYPSALLEAPISIEEIGIGIFTTFVLPFEVISLILLAAMIGAIFLAKKEVPL